MKNFQFSIFNFHLKLQNKNSKLAGGFTLTELLVVIVVIGILATIGLMVIDPKEQIDRANDSRREQSLTIIAKALATYSIEHTSQYPPATGPYTGCTPVPANWLALLKCQKYLEAIPTTITGTECTINLIGNFCYQGGGASGLVYTKLQAKIALKRCPAGSTAAFFSWHSDKVDPGVECLAAGEPAP